jgi:glucose dehydrogenase
MPRRRFRSDDSKLKCKRNRATAAFDSCRWRALAIRKRAARTPSEVVFWGVGNPAPHNPLNRPGDNVFTDSILAIGPRTAAIVWHHQETPNDPFVFDG